MSSIADEASNAEHVSLDEDSSFLQPSSSPERTVMGDDEIEARPAARASASVSSDEDQDDSEEQRENRFNGPASTWYDHTREERGLAASLDQQCANNLSIHLYNTHALKRRLRDPQLAAAAKPWQSKRTWLRMDEEGKAPWHPDSQWTAWPLPARDVPRREEVFGVSPGDVDEDNTYRKSELWRPSDDLENEIQALMLSKAKERFRQRHWVDADDDFHAQDVQVKREYQARDDRSDSDLPETKSARLPQIATYQSALLADDHEAATITRPTLDDLVAGLHTSRVGQRRVRSTSKSRSRSGTTKSRSKSRSQAPAESSARGRTRIKAEISATGSSEESSDADSDHDDNDSTIPLSNKQRGNSQRSRHELGQRDWSDVLGIAALVGWDSAVIDRVARRCASLFGEGMAFRTMHETAAERPNDVVVEYKPGMISATVDSEAGTGSEEQEPTATAVYSCPYQECPRHAEGHVKAWRWREHLRRVHKLSKRQIADIEGRQGHGETAFRSPSAEASLSGDTIEADEVGNELTSDVDSSDSEMVGGVHNNGFLRPITGGALGRGPNVRSLRQRDTDGQKTEMVAGKRRKMNHREDNSESRSISPDG
ncbi:hypothetical protein LTR91_019201 [Friedmanniomyces endolithicus]|uniref:Rrn9 domain-containing protein n=1 Tax=Friedmanniomyces endolithicus TaxID=329885 RepID=A0AAN6J229_9PEZI|nr:hypothetical protein LTR82_015455 [Friedmanniomyces endolithicus]KAK0920601.1 hypothetical protein LTR57_009651 [Friedmanniomyces endolithicus]KAK0960164.1 hypothetical protein LTS01_021031 [Friedmanniomyces endolithicus]KAK0962991.1 hypothetical protein LTR91_019201 [Friedmanniomyces endolithicus]KAK1008208.1 hypothetical protein LTR54_005999 [Friedmanniomyces endolithicus]